MKLNLVKERKKVALGSSNSRGGVLLSVLLTLFLFSFLWLQLLTTYQQTIDFTNRTRRSYQAKIAKELFLADYPQLAKEKGQWHFTQGELVYQKQSENLKITVQIQGKSFSFTEPLEEITKK